MSENKETKIRCLVVKDKMSKTRVAKVERRVRYPLIGKFVTRTTKVTFHDENNESHVGDEVYVVNSRPISKRKSFRLHSIAQKAE